MVVSPYTILYQDKIILCHRPSLFIFIHKFNLLDDDLRGKSTALICLFNQHQIFQSDCQNKLTVKQNCVKTSANIVKCLCEHLNNADYSKSNIYRKLFNSTFQKLIETLSLDLGHFHTEWKTGAKSDSMKGFSQLKQSSVFIIIVRIYSKCKLQCLATLKFISEESTYQRQDIQFAGSQSFTHSINLESSLNIHFDKLRDDTNRYLTIANKNLIFCYCKEFYLTFTAVKITFKTATKLHCSHFW